MSEKILQDQAFSDLIEKVSKTITDAVETGATLDEVKSVIRGDALNYSPDTPALWIFPGEATCTSERGAIRETWKVPFTFVAVVSMGPAPQHHTAKAIRIVSQAQSLIVENRRLGLNFVQDVVKTGMLFRSNRSPDGRRGLYAAAGTISVTINIREV